MNKIYSKVWNASLGTLVVASEHARAHGKGGGSKRLRAAAAILVAGFMATGSVYAAAGVSPCDAFYAAGHKPVAAGVDALVCGLDASAYGRDSIAFGTRAASLGNYSMAMGYQSKALDYSVVLGANALSNGDYSTVIGAGDPTFINPDGSSRGNFAGAYGSALGWGAQSNNRGTTALGSYAHAGNAASGAGFESYDTAVGYKAGGVGGYSTALGSFTLADAPATVAVGGSARASAANATALGTFSAAIGANSVALGQGSTAVDGDSVSVGHAAADLDYLGNPYGSDLNRTITHVANGAVSAISTDAVNGSQLYAATTRYVSINSTGGSNGNNDGATGTDAVAIGNYAAASGTDAWASGYSVLASGAKSIALGFGAVASGYSGLALSSQSEALGANEVSIGVFAGLTSTAIKTDGDTAYGSNNHLGQVNIGPSAGQNVAGYSGVYVGGTAGQQSTGIQNVAVGDRSGRSSTGDQNTAVGARAGNAVRGSGNVAIGFQAGSYIGIPGGIQTNNTLALGSNAYTNVSDAVALGSGSIAATAAGVAGYVPAGASAGQIAAIMATTGTLGAVSVGDVANNKFRQINGVAAGTANSDAVNVSQLDAATSAATKYFKANSTGNDAQATGIDSVAIGPNSIASGKNSLASGNGAAAGVGSVANGYGASAGIINTGIDGTPFRDGVGYGVAVGNAAKTNGIVSTAIGSNAQSAEYAVAIGGGMSSSNSAVAGQRSVAVGSDAGAYGHGNVAIGNHARAGTLTDPSTDDPHNTAVGYTATASGGESTATGSYASATGEHSTALGNKARAAGNSSLAMGDGAVATADNSVALGAGSVASLANTVSVGAVGAERQIVNVAAGTAGTDAVNKDQLDAVATQAGLTDALSLKYDDASKARATLGGVSGTVLANVADGAVNATSKEAVNGSQLQTTNDAVAQNSSDITTNTTAIGAINNTAVFYTDATHTAVSLGDGTTPVTVGNVAAGTLATDAVNKGQLDALESQAGQTDASAVKYDDVSSKDQVTLGGANGTRLSNVQASDVTSDAATVGQIDDLLSALGGGAMLQMGGALVMPTYVIQGGSYRNVGDAFGALDLALTSLDSRVTTLEQQVSAGGGTNSLVATDGVNDGSDAASVQAGSKGVAVGANAKAAGNHDTAIGGNATVEADGSTAVGANSTITAAASNAVAVGEGASVSADSGTALGQGSSVTAAGAVALGQGSVADRANTVSVGSATNNRQITHVAAGNQGTDAANVDQVQQALVTAKTYSDANAQQTLQSANAYTDSKFANIATTGDVNNLRDAMNEQFHVVNKRIDQVGAMGAAMAQMAFSTQGVNTPNRVGVGVAGYRGEAALSVGYSRQLSSKANLTFGASVSGNEASGGVGVGFGW